jgi:ribosomal protein S12 methylthiotransferase accessory factor YcaO
MKTNRTMLEAVAADDRLDPTCQSHASWCPLSTPASPRFGYAETDGRVVRTANGFLLWLSRSESELVAQLVTLSAHGHALPIAAWLDPTSPDFARRVVELPGLLARGVVRTQTRDGATWVALNLPAHPLVEAPTAPESECKDCAVTAERIVQADVIGAFLRARGGRWLLRSDAEAPTCDHRNPSRTPGPITATAEEFRTYSTSWRGGSATATRKALLGLVDVDRGIIAGIRRGSGLPAAIPVWFAGPNRAFSTADPSGLSWRLPGNASGKGLTDDEAQLSALAEAAERWSGTWQQRDGTTGVVGRDLATGEEVVVASDLVYMGHPPVGGIVRHTDSNGLAAGVTLADAQLQALLEIIERDAISAWWEGQTRSARVTAPADEALQPFIDWLEWLGLVMDLRQLPSIDSTTTLLAIGWLPQTHRWLYGAGTHIDPRIAMRRALLELVQSTAAALATSKQLAPGRGIPTTLNPRLFTEHAAATSGPPMPTGPQFATVSAAVKHLTRYLAAQGRRTFAVDVTRADVGVPVARVLVQGQKGMPLPMR